MSEQHKPRFLGVDFFCGAGGTTRGMIDAGGFVIAGIDKDEACKDTYVKNNKNLLLDRARPRYLAFDVFKKTRQYESGQQHELFKALEQLIPEYRRRMPGIPLLFAICAPCQPFTRVSRKEMSDGRLAKRRKDRNLLGESAEFIDRFRPELVLSENVRGIGDKQFGGVWTSFQRKLKESGYAIGAGVVCASRFGVPQFRKRSILIAVRRDVVSPDHLQSNELIVPKCDPKARIVSVKEVLGHLPPIQAGELHHKIRNHRARSLSELNKARLAHSVPGKSNECLEDTPKGDLSLSCHRKVNKKLGERCFNDVYTRMRADRPSPTITTKCHSISNGRFGHYDPKQIRGISLREAAILQSFPDSYVFYPANQIEPLARMIGNAVPPKLAAYFSSYLARSLRSI